MLCGQCWRLAAAGDTNAVQDLFYRMSRADRCWSHSSSFSLPQPAHILKQLGGWMQTWHCLQAADGMILQPYCVQVSKWSRSGILMIDCDRHDDSDRSRSQSWLCIVLILSISLHYLIQCYIFQVYITVLQKKLGTQSIQIVHSVAINQCTSLLSMLLFAKQSIVSEWCGQCICSSTSSSFFSTHAL